MIKRVCKKSALITCIAALSMFAFANSALAVDLTVYTAVEAEDLKRYAETFNKEHPDINIKWVRDSTGIVTAKLLAEKNNPQADVIWGIAATSLLIMKAEGMFEPYKPKELKCWTQNSMTVMLPQAGLVWMPGLQRFVTTPSKPRSTI